MRIEDFQLDYQRLRSVLGFGVASLDLLCQSHDLLALGAVAILRSVPVNLLALDTAVAIGLASLAQLSGLGVQFDAACFAILSHFA